MKSLRIKLYPITMLYLRLSSLEIQVIIIIHLLKFKLRLSSLSRETYPFHFIGIGKSCVLKRLVDNEFKEDHDVTVGVEFGSFLIKVEDKVIKL